MPDPSASTLQDDRLAFHAPRGARSRVTQHDNDRIDPINEYMRLPCSSTAAPGFNTCLAHDRHITTSGDYSTRIHFPESHPARSVRMSGPSHRSSRRRFLQGSLSAAALLASGSIVKSETTSPAEKLNLAFVGVAGKGATPSTSSHRSIATTSPFATSTPKPSPTRMTSSPDTAPTPISARCSSRRTSTPSSSPRPITTTPSPRWLPCSWASMSTAKSR